MSQRSQLHGLYAALLRPEPAGKSFADLSNAGMFYWSAHNDALQKRTANTFDAVRK